jgi:hypothetical protein
MTDTDKTYVQEVCTFFYPSNLPAEMNDTLADLAGRMLYAAIQKSKG